MRVSFLIIGSMKSGTSSVSRFLEGHPGVCLPPRLETNFFSNNEVFARGEDWYHAHFDICTDDQRIGEGSNNYSCGQLYPDTAARIHAYNPDMRLVYFVRHPLERIAAAWVQNRADFISGTPETLEEAVTRLPERYVDPSCYARNLRRYLDHFPREQIFIGILEDLAADPGGVQGALCDFLGVARPATTFVERVNPTAGKQVPTGLYRRLRDFPPARAVSRLLSPDARRRLRERFLMARVEGRPQLSGALKAKVLEEVGPDAREFLALAGKPVDFWKFHD